MNKDLAQTILYAASLAFGEEKTDITECSPAFISGWDSLSFLSFVMALEEQLNISIEPDHIAEMSEGGHKIIDVLKRYGQ